MTDTIDSFDRILDYLDPAVCWAPHLTAVDDAIDRFDTSLRNPRDALEAKVLLTRYVKSVRAALLEMADADRYPDPIAWAEAQEALRVRYGDNGLGVACENIASGADGGLYAVLRKIGGQLAERHAQQQIDNAVNGFWNMLSPEGRCEAARRYIEQYASLLPTELLTGGGVQLQAFLPKYLEAHPRVVLGLATHSH